MVVPLAQSKIHMIFIDLALIVKFEGGGHMGSFGKMSQPWCRRIARRAFLILTLSSAIYSSVSSQQMSPPSAGTISDAIGLFAREKSAAEQYAVVFSTIAKNNGPLYLRGFKLYADAKAEFDGLVTELRFDVTNGRKPTQSQTFNKTLQAAAEKRVAFTSFVSDGQQGG
jgi:hypothetical protein